MRKRARTPQGHWALEPEKVRGASKECFLQARCVIEGVCSNQDHSIVRLETGRSKSHFTLYRKASTGRQE